LIVAGCNYVISCDNLSYSLPEVKRGIFPLQVMESLSHIIGLKKTIDWCIRGYKIDANKAFDWGLIDHICKHDEVEKSINDWVSSFSENSQSAIEFGLKIYHEYFQDNSKHEKLEKLFREMVEQNQLSTDF
jgi:enoyl-CoA hydratase/carnithine racemase